MGLHVDLEAVFQHNMKKTVIWHIRSSSYTHRDWKERTIVSSMKEITQLRKKERRKLKTMPWSEELSNAKNWFCRFGLTPEQVKSIKLPRPRLGPIKEIYSLEEVWFSLWVQTNSFRLSQINFPRWRRLFILNH